MSEEFVIVAAGTSKSEVESMIPFARAVAPKSKLVLLGLVPVPLTESLSAGALGARRLRTALSPAARRAGAFVMVRVGHDLWAELGETIAEQKCNLVLMNWLNTPPAEWVRALTCDLALVKPPFPRKRLRILLPIRGGRNAALALRLATTLAESKKGYITVLHSAASSADSQIIYRGFLTHLNELAVVKRRVIQRGDAPNAITKSARRHDLLILGAVAQPRDGEPAIGATALRVLNKTQIPALVVRAAAGSSPLTQLRERLPEAVAKQWLARFSSEPERAPLDYTISIVVDKWFAENTFHAHEFQALKELVKLKEKQGLTISLGLPALNEARTIGNIIRLVKKNFMRRYPLLDEVVVIDSMSTDRTVEIAQDLGVPVVRHPEILPQHGARVGKGEALWKSLYVLRGDLIAWIDTDIANIHPRFIFGILGPLIREPRLQYIKGFYHRPLRYGGKVETRGGGRVTELVARPLLNLFYPELSGLVQPLAGEYAGRREVLEQVPFFAGYGVETGLLIDIWSKFGLQAIGQVDLEQRIHRNQSLLQLSKMAFEIIQVVLQRTSNKGSAGMLNEMHQSMKLIRYARDEFQLDVADLRVCERPPMNTIPEYREKLKTMRDRSLAL